MDFRARLAYLMNSQHEVAHAIMRQRLKVRNILLAKYLFQVLDMDHQYCNGLLHDDTVVALLIIAENCVFTQPLAF
jgi:hypothetical protein